MGKPLTLSKLSVERFSQARETLFEGGLVFIVLLSAADVTPGCERVAVCAHLVEGGHSAKAGNLIGNARPTKATIGTGDTLDLGVRELLLLARAWDERPQLSRVDKKNLISPRPEASEAFSIF